MNIKQMLVYVLIHITFQKALKFWIPPLPALEYGETNLLYAV